MRIRRRKPELTLTANSANEVGPLCAFSGCERAPVEKLTLRLYAGSTPNRKLWPVTNGLCVVHAAEVHNGMQFDANLWVGLSLTPAANPEIEIEA